MLLDLDTLKEKIVGKENIFWRSFIELKDDYIYAIIKDQDNYYLGKFDHKIKTMAKSSEKIAKDTFISFYGEYIYINGDDKNILILNKNDLSLVDKIKP